MNWRCLVGLHDWQITDTPAMVPGVTFGKWWVAPCECSRCKTSRVVMVDHKNKWKPKK